MEITISKDINKIIQMIKESNNNTILDFLFNLLLVKYEAREAYLLEVANYMNEDIDTLLIIASDIELFIKKDKLSLENYPRYFITKKILKKEPDSDEEIGNLLGMKDAGGYYFNYKMKRLDLQIYEEKMDTSITSEVVLGDINDIDNQKYAEDKVNKFNNVMIKLKLPYRFVYKYNQDDGTIKRFEELKMKNLEYIIQNKDEYINDLANEILGDEKSHPIIILFNKSIANMRLFNIYYPLFMYIYDIINNEILQYKNYHEKVENINNKFIEIISIEYK